MIIGDFLAYALKQLIPGKGFYYVGDILNEKSFYEKFNVIVGSDENGSAILSNNRDDFGVTWEQVSDKIQELQVAEPMRLLREERNRRLAETDYLALKDVFMTTDEELYRQQLRDITKGARPKLDENGNLTNITWPVRPK